MFRNKAIEETLRDIFSTNRKGHTHKVAWLTQRFEEEEQLSSTKEEREKFKKDWEIFKKESSGAKELREQLEFVEELKKVPVEKPVEISKRLPIREWVKQYKNPTAHKHPQEGLKLVPKNLAKFPHYFAKVPNFTHLDIYMVSEMFQLNSYQHHIVKKAIATGNRGTKDQVKDLQEVIATAEAWIETIEANKVL